jgi:hypothetical protein
MFDKAEAGGYAERERTERMNLSASECHPRKFAGLSLAPACIRHIGLLPPSLPASDLRVGRARFVESESGESKFLPTLAGSFDHRLIWKLQ